jgi:hypothetical protein
MNPYQLEKYLARLESDIHALEDELHQITQDLNTASEAGDVEKVTTLGQRYASVETELNRKMEEWAELG